MLVQNILGRAVLCKLNKTMYTVEHVFVDKDNLKVLLSDSDGCTICKNLCNEISLTLQNMVSWKFESANIRNLEERGIISAVSNQRLLSRSITEAGIKYTICAVWIKESYYELIDNSNSILRPAVVKCVGVDDAGLFHQFSLPSETLTL